MGQIGDGSLAAREPPGEGDPADRFAEEARAAGIVLPRPKRPSPWLSIVVIVVVVVSAMGLGLITGWTDLRGAASVGQPTLYGPQNCGPTPAVLSASTDPTLDPGFQSWVSSDLYAIVNTTGGCIHLSFAESSPAGPGAQLSSRAVDFATAAAAPNSTEAAQFPAPAVFYPLALSAVAVVYNLPGIPSGLNLTVDALAGIFSGTITSWDDPAIVAPNPGVDLAGLPSISVAYRSDASLANTVLSDYLASGNSTWQSRYGTGATVPWPVGWPANGSAALLGHVGTTPGSIGFVQLMNSSLAGVSTARLQNPDGGFVSPDPANVTDAAAAAGTGPAVLASDWANVSLVNAPGAASYPLTVLTYVGLYRDLGTAYGGAFPLTNATWLMTLLWWLSESVALAPLPSPYAAEAQSAMTNVTYDGQKILQVQESETGENGGETGEF
ncbi:MAG TPA: substrate-binding domain-containing protein [Thermoplasmata archaeon]|nr:substrate-binding domain-containing protein [Thermoplasmata archaeon]